MSGLSFRIALAFFFGQLAVINGCQGTVGVQTSILLDHRSISKYTLPVSIQ
jgi:hypothetical protein